MLFFPNAKINLGLHITEKRPDGFHNIETIFYPVSLSDILEFVVDKNLPHGTCRLYCTGLPTNAETDDNLVMKSYALLHNLKGLPGLEIHLHKIIPMGAGLGGGSADAAFMLKELNAYFAFGLTNGELESVASAIGSDCPFFIRNQPLLAVEKGNIFIDAELPDLKGYQILLVNPGLHIPTPEAYAGVVPGKPEFNLANLVSMPVDEWKNLLYNDFELSVFSRYPLLADIKEKLYQLGAIYASMSGSGSTLYGLFLSPPEIPENFRKWFTWMGRMQ